MNTYEPAISVAAPSWAPHSSTLFCCCATATPRRYIIFIAYPFSAFILFVYFYDFPVVIFYLKLNVCNNKQLSWLHVVCLAFHGCVTALLFLNFFFEFSFTSVSISLSLHLSATPPLGLAAAPAAYLMSLYLLQNSFLWFLQICNPTCSHSLFIYTYLAQPTTCCGCKCMYVWVCVCECVRVRQFNCVNPLASITKAVAAMPDLNASEWIPQI